MGALREAAHTRPENLTGRVLLGAYKARSGWISLSNKVTNLNIFSTLLTIEKMVRMTLGGVEECGEQGDYLAWRETHWALHGEAVMEEVASEEPSLDWSHSWLSLFTEGFNIDECMQHCEKVG